MNLKLNVYTEKSYDICHKITPFIIPSFLILSVFFSFYCFKTEFEKHILNLNVENINIISSNIFYIEMLFSLTFIGTLFLYFKTKKWIEFVEKGI